MGIGNIIPSYIMSHFSHKSVLVIVVAVTLYDLSQVVVSSLGTLEE